MKQEDVDKKIGMPDVDAEWARFEREVIGRETASHRRMAAWAAGIGIAAAIALFVMLTVGRGETDEQPTLAQKTLPPEDSSIKAQSPLLCQQSVPESRADRSGRAQGTIMHLGGTGRNSESIFELPDSALQGRIAGLTIVPSSADLGPYFMRLRGNSPEAQDSERDSVLVVVNGQPTTTLMSELMEEEGDLYRYFFDRQQYVDDITVLKDEAARAHYGIQGRDFRGILEIATTPFTPVRQLTPAQLKARRLAYLLGSYRKGFEDDADRERFAPDLYDTTTEERFFGLLAQQHGRLRSEYFGPVGRDAHGVYVPLVREAVIVANDPAWLDKNGKVVSKENSSQLDNILSEIDLAASQADKSIARTDSVERRAFIFGGTVVEGEPRPLYTYIWRYAPRGLWETAIHFLPDSDASSYWWAEIYGTINGQRRVNMHLHAVDKLYAADCPEILANSRMVEGTVLNECDEPLADAIVSVGRASASETEQVRTDSTGHFKLCLPFRNATFEVGHSGHKAVRITQPADTAIIIRLQPVALLKDVKARPKETKKPEEFPLKNK